MNESTTENNSLENGTNDTLEISKSQRKREAQEMLKLARELTLMPESRLKRLPLEAELLSEIEFARSIKAHGARKRQLMTVGKILRQRDNEELLDAVYNFERKDRQANARFHHIEAWRERLLEGSDQVLSALLEQVPTANAQTLRQLVRNAGKEARLGKPPASSRKLFKLLRELDEQNPLPPL